MTVDEYREKIMQLRPSNFMMLGGAAAGIVGSSNSGGDVIFQLQRSVLEFTKLYKTPGNGHDLETAGQNVVANILVASTVDAINQKRADELIDDLEQLINERGKQA